MPTAGVRPFRRSDRDQLTQLINAHAEAVVPGMGASVSTVLGALERQPGEFITDPWVAERLTLVAVQQERVVAAAHLLRYFADERAGVAARGVGSIEWFVFWPQAPAGNPCWPDATEAAGLLMAACVGQLEPVGRDPSGGRRRAPGAGRLRGTRAVAARARALRAIRIRPYRGHRGRLPGQGR